LNNIKELITFNIKKFIISLIILSLLCIINYCYVEYYSIEFKYQFIHPVYSQESCPTYEESLTSPIKGIKNPKELPLDTFPSINNKLFNITISGSSPTICHNRASQEYYLSPMTKESSITLDVNPNKLKDDIPPITETGTKLNLVSKPIKNLIDNDKDDILNSLDTVDNSDPNNPKSVPISGTKCLENTAGNFVCNRGKTELIITEFDQNIILGASNNNTDGIIVISDRTGDNSKKHEPALIQACKEQTKYRLPPYSVIEIVCD
jgi:hypothetical protein